MTPLLERLKDIGAVKSSVNLRVATRTRAAVGSDAKEETSVHGEAAFWGGSLDDSQVGKN
ncbi:hypothetical protein [Alicyclobacillus mengziensis]|uniref:Uncharacterized protein n=1 Tax=Alicyclobacillus mengziensis TaxID=2931921 RepID=A0A9X7VW35_9BACL|nr:hypothetical protein [Alicyclobacillus mengziensis]QSO45940.1 hypothetical protein JZ786_15510 [Alicyclobacillus mengziensis]